jgi:hypothetical protein
VSLVILTGSKELTFLGPIIGKPKEVLAKRLFSQLHGGKGRLPVSEEDLEANIAVCPFHHSLKKY